jgi:hypothetical protein
MRALNQSKLDKRAKAEHNTQDHFPARTQKNPQVEKPLKKKKKKSQQKSVCMLMLQLKRK